MTGNYIDYGYQSAAPNWSDSYVMPHLRRFIGQPRGPILDIGCGNGAIARLLLDDGFDVYGIDASKSGIKIANSSAPGRFFLHDIQSDWLPDPIANRRFVTAISTEVITHLYSPRGLIDFAYRILDEDGEFIVSAPYHGYLKNVALALSGRMDAHFTVLWDGGFIKFFSRRTLERMIEERGFEVTDFVGAGRWPFLWKTMLVKATKPRGL